MAEYYVNPETHEVHVQTCDHFPRNPVPLGWFSRCEDAVAEAKRRGYRRANGCYHCCRPCHTG